MRLKIKIINFGSFREEDWNVMLTDNDRHKDGNI